jgi:hypothetical protein
LPAMTLAWGASVSAATSDAPAHSRDCASTFGERQRKRRCKAANRSGSIPEVEWLMGASGLVRASRYRSPLKPAAGVASRLSDSFSTAVPPPRRRGTCAVSRLSARDRAFSSRNRSTTRIAAKPSVSNPVPSVCSSLSSMPILKHEETARCIHRQRTKSR